jgi:hypothetical protein
MGMKIEKVFVESAQGMPSLGTFFRAWEGFRKRGYDCELFEPKQLREGSLPIQRNTLIAGGIPSVESALRQLNVPVPMADNLPAALEKYRGRRAWTSTWGELRAKYRTSGPPEPLWVKSLRRNKGAPSIAVYDADDIALAKNLPDDHEVLVSEYVLFESEWRCFVRDGQILDVCRYQGDVFQFPDRKVIQNAIADFTTAPAAYGIDFGVLSSGKTVLVEVNEGYSLNPYGLEATEYSELLETRWVEMMKA